MDLYLYKDYDILMLCLLFIPLPIFTYLYNIRDNLISKIMKIVIPKGAYHNQCRNKHNSKSLQHTT